MPRFNAVLHEGHLRDSSSLVHIDIESHLVLPHWQSFCLFLDPSTHAHEAQIHCCTILGVNQSVSLGVIDLTALGRDASLVDEIPELSRQSEYWAVRLPAPLQRLIHWRNWAGGNDLLGYPTYGIDLSAKIPMPIQYVAELCSRH